MARETRITKLQIDALLPLDRGNKLREGHEINPKHGMNISKYHNGYMTTSMLTFEIWGGSLLVYISALSTFTTSNHCHNYSTIGLLFSEKARKIFLEVVGSPQPMHIDTAALHDMKAVMRMDGLIV